MKNSTALIVLTYKRTKILPEMVSKLNAQSSTDFDLFISHSGSDRSLVQYISTKVRKEIPCEVVYSDTNEGCWRRHELARTLASRGYKRIMFLDDDIVIPNNYVELALTQYEDLSYKSWWAWNLNGGYTYEKDRTRITDPNVPANYCGAGASIVDSRLFLEENYFNLPTDDAKWIDDIWMSYYTNHILGWKLSYLDIPNVSFHEAAADANALYLKISSRELDSKINKREFVDLLKNDYGWRPE